MKKKLTRAQRTVLSAVCAAEEQDADVSRRPVYTSDTFQPSPLIELAKQGLVSLQYGVDATMEPALLVHATAAGIEEMRRIST